MVGLFFRILFFIMMISITYMFVKLLLAYPLFIIGAVFGFWLASIGK